VSLGCLGDTVPPSFLGVWGHTHRDITNTILTASPPSPELRGIFLLASRLDASAIKQLAQASQLNMMHHPRAQPSTAAHPPTNSS